MKNRIEECRKYAELTLEEVAAKMNTFLGNLKAAENTSDPFQVLSGHGIENLAAVLHVTPAYLVGWTDKNLDKQSVGATIYLNDREASYIDLDCLSSIDERFVNGRDNFGHEVHIPIHSILYIAENLD